MLKIKILIIDDEEDYCMILKHFFSKKGCEVFLAYTLKQGLQSLHEHSIDILFLDNNLPDGNGWQVVDKIIAEKQTIKIYLISAYKHKTDFTGNSLQVTVWEKPISFQLLEQILTTPEGKIQQKESM